MKPSVSEIFLPLLCAGCITAATKAHANDLQRVCTLDVNVVLKDSPGPRGHPLAATPWKVASGAEPEGLALIEPESLLAKGITDHTGRVVLSAEQQLLVSAASCIHGKSIWLVSPGRAEKIESELRPVRWSKQEELFYRLKAAGFFSNVAEYSREFFKSRGCTDELQYARKIYSVTSDDALLAALRQSDRQPR